MERLKFSKAKYLSYLVDHPDHWYNRIDGKEVEYIEGSNLVLCGGHFILKEWCEPINDSDNNDK